MGPTPYITERFPHSAASTRRAMCMVVDDPALVPLADRGYNKSQDGNELLPVCDAPVFAVSRAWGSMGVCSGQSAPAAGGI